MATKVKVTHMAKARIFAGTTLYDPHTREVTGIRFDVELAEGPITVSILEAPTSVDLLQIDSVQRILGQLGLALSEAALHPERILWHLRDKR
jgi:hypothetical protein